jgi:hypothetical protein
VHPIGKSQEQNCSAQSKQDTSTILELISNLQPPQSKSLNSPARTKPYRKQCSAAGSYNLPQLHQKSLPHSHYRRCNLRPGPFTRVSQDLKYMAGRANRLQGRRRWSHACVGLEHEGSCSPRGYPAAYGGVVSGFEAEHKQSCEE